MREERPRDNEYYEQRVEPFSQGDIFRDVPLAFPSPAEELIAEDRPPGRRFLSGPLEIGTAMLETPTCSMRSQVAYRNYSHAVRTLVPLLPIDDDLIGRLDLSKAKLGLLRKYDGLINYMYVPGSAALELPESLALLYMPITLHHDFLEGQRVTQMAVEGARQLQRKLVWFHSGLLLARGTFEPPLD